MIISTHHALEMQCLVPTEILPHQYGASVSLNNVLHFGCVAVSVCVLLRGGHVPKGTVVLGLSRKLAFSSDFRASSVHKCWFYLLLLNLAFRSNGFGRFVTGQGLSQKVVVLACISTGFFLLHGKTSWAESKLVLSLRKIFTNLVE